MNGGLKKRVLAVCHETDPNSLASTVRKFGADDIIIIQIDQSVKGIWTDVLDDYELIRIGYPSKSDDPWFQYFSPLRKQETGFSILLSRTTFNRQPACVYLCEESLVPAVRHALAKFDIPIGWGNAFRKSFWLSGGLIRRQLKRCPLQSVLDSQIITPEIVD